MHYCFFLCGGGGDVLLSNHKKNLLICSTNIHYFKLDNKCLRLCLHLFIISFLWFNKLGSFAIRINVFSKLHSWHFPVSGLYVGANWIIDHFIVWSIILSLKFHTYFESAVELFSFLVSRDDLWVLYLSLKLLPANPI